MDLNTVFSLDQLLHLYVDKFKDLKFGKTGTTIYDPIHYFIAHEGKQIRPLLLLASCNLFSGDLEEALHPAFAIQMFHNFTLVHDDIMDEADTRRGQPTVHKKFGTNKAIIAGDIMMISSYDYLLNVHPMHIKEIHRNFNATAIQIIEGQRMDIDFENRVDIREAEYLKMIAYKTSVLLAESLRIGAIIANATDANKELIYNFGLDLGLSFQIKDDWLDAFGTGEKFGKKIGGDIVRNKKTILFVKAWEAADAVTKSKITSLLNCEVDSQKIAEMLNIYNDLGVNDKVKALMADYFSTGMEHLKAIQVDEERKQQLMDYAHKIYHRDR